MTNQPSLPNASERTAATAVSGSRRSRSRRRWVVVCGIAALGIAALPAGHALWRAHVRAQLLARLPSPDLTRAPAELRQKIAQARAQVGRAGDNLAAVIELGRLYHANNDLVAAEACWRLLSERQPREARWTHYLGDLCRTRGDEQRMRQYLHDTLARDPDYSPAWLKLAEVEFKGGEIEAAERSYRERLKRMAGDPYARLGLARIALLAGRTDAAETQLQEIIRDAPEFSSARNLYAKLLQERGDVAGAAEQTWQATVAGRFREADDPWLLELRAYCYDSRQLTVWGSQEAQTNHPDRAREFFERAIAVAPDDPAPYAELGQLLLDRGEREKARDLLARGITRCPFDEKLHGRLSDALRQLGQPQAALENDQRALVHAPDSVDLVDSLGESQAMLGRFAEAEATFALALRKSPNAVGPELNLGGIYAKTGRRREARQILEAALNTHPSHPKLLVALGSLALEEGRLDDAERVIPEYFRHYPGNANARRMMTQLHVGRAIAAFGRGDLAAAETYCTTGLAAVPDAAELLGLLGNIRLRKGDLPQALSAMEACQKLLPGDPRAVLPLASLYRQLKRPADARRVLLEALEWLLHHDAASATGPIDRMLEQLPTEQL